MKDEPEIPVLDDLISPGGKLEPAIGDGLKPAYESDQNDASTIPQGALFAMDQDLEIIDSIEYPSTDDLLVEEEVRSILERHMELALNEIMQLIKRRNSG
jgi:hypothetical protein